MQLRGFSDRRLKFPPRSAKSCFDVAGFGWKVSRTAVGRNLAVRKVSTTALAVATNRLVVYFVTLIVLTLSYTVLCEVSGVSDECSIGVTSFRILWDE